MTLGADQVFAVTNMDVTHTGGDFGTGGTVSLTDVALEFPAATDSLGLGVNGPNTLNMSSAFILQEAGISVLPGTGGTWTDVIVTAPVRNSGNLVVAGVSNSFNEVVQNASGGVWDNQSDSSSFGVNLTNQSGAQFTFSGGLMSVTGNLSNSGDLTFTTSSISPDSMDVFVGGVFSQGAADATLAVGGTGALKVRSSLDILAGTMNVGRPVSVFGDFRSRGLVRMAADLTVVDDRTTADLQGTTTTQDWAIAELGAQFVAVGGTPVLTVPSMNFDDVTLDGVPLVLDRTAFADNDEAFVPHIARNMTLVNMGSQSQITILEDSRILDFDSITFDETDPSRVYLDVTDTDGDVPVLEVEVNLDGGGSPSFDPGGFTISVGDPVITWLPNPGQG